MKRTREEEEEQDANPTPLKKIRPEVKVVINSVFAQVYYYPIFLTKALADEALQTLLTESPWATESVKIFGKMRNANRQTCFYGDPGIQYTYTGLSKPALAWTPRLLAIKAHVENALGLVFNYALLNLYQTGENGLGYHADDETTLIPGSVIASISLGSTRDFLLKKGEETHKVSLAHGSLLTMGGNTQKNYKHSVPVRKKVIDARINITFRQVRV